MLVELLMVSRSPSTARCEAQGGGGAAAVVRLGAFGVVASAKREVGGPRSGGVVVVGHSGTGGVADITSAGVHRM